MERDRKLLLILTVSLVVLLASDAEGARTMKSMEKVDHQPQNFGGIGGSFPSPGFGRSFPSPGFGGSFPSPGFSFGSPGAGSFCSFFPGTTGCVPVRPSNPGGSAGGGDGGGSP